jgi:hypothetical protein
MTRWMLTAAAMAVSGLALAKLPAPDDAAKAAAAAAATKAAWQGKVDAYQLCKVQDKIAAKYKSSHPDAAKGAPATAAPATAAAPAASAASSPQGTPVASAAPTPAAVPPCSDPGPLAAAPPQQKPLESSEAHSPAATAASPPSVRAESGTMTSGKGGGAAPGPGKK